MWDNKRKEEAVCHAIFQNTKWMCLRNMKYNQHRTERNNYESKELKKMVK